ncbi:MAG: response regulator [Lachnospiraceae bacterium]|nr:response regulator [Lachnospiraceae bacterium]
MLSSKQLTIFEMVEYLLFASMHVVYSAWTKDEYVTMQVAVFAAGMSIITVACLIVVKNDFLKQIGFAVCAMIGVHLIGVAMGSLAFGICIYMAAGTMMSMYGERKLNYCYFLIVNVTLAFELIVEYDVIVSRVPIQYYVMMILTCEIYLLTESYLVLLYQQKVQEIQIQNELLSIAQKSKDEFLANMSHEIRTPMNAIVGMSELVLREDINPKVAQYCHNIQSSGQNLLAIINDILDFSKIESGKMNIIYEPYSVVTAVQEAVNTAMFRRGYKNVDIIVDFDPNIPRLLNGDEIRIRQIITNIVTNSVKFTEQGYIYINMECYMRKGANRLKISVKDSGIGIKREDIAHLFESFSRLDSKKNRSVEGTGLGLPICKRLVELMDGTIEVESVYGEGTTVTIDVPQRIIDGNPSLSLKQKGISVLTFVLSQNELFKQREGFYRSASRRMWGGLSVHYEFVNTFEDFKSAVEHGNATHVMLDVEAYRTNREFMHELVKRLKVFVYCDSRYTFDFGEDIYGINIPFSATTIISAINGEAFYNELTYEEPLETSFIIPKANILVVDDNEINRKVAEGILKLYKANCILVSGGREAISVLESMDIDLVFMDHMMPELDGIETTKIIRQRGTEKYRNVPIVAMTANVVNDVKQMFLKSGFQDFLAKPISVKDVGAVLKHWLPRALIEYEPEGDTKPERSYGVGNVPHDTVAGDTVAGNPVSSDAVTGGTVIGDPVTGNSVGKTVTARDFVAAVEHKKHETIDDTKQTRDYVFLDGEKALENMGGQRDLYKELLEYCLELEEKRWNDIQEMFDKKDWKEYTILVHALKGGMRSLGIEELAIAAQGQEFACKEDRIDDAIAGHGSLKELYDWTHRSIEHYLETYTV